MSLLMPLCEELGISVNELLSGQRLDDISYKKKAEENMVSIMKEKEENKKKLQTAFLMGLISTVAFITLILVVAYYAEVIALPVKLLLVTVACAIFGVGLYVVMHTEWTVGYYRCQCCGHHFVPTFFEYQKSMHLCTTRRLKCPECGRKSWCKKVLTREK